MVAAFDYCLHGRGGAAPSIDTAMHGLVERRPRRPPPSRLRHRPRDRRRRRGADPPLLRRPGRLGAVAPTGVPARPRHRGDPRATDPTPSARSSAVTASRPGARPPTSARRARSRSSGPPSGSSPTRAGRSRSGRSSPGHEPLPARRAARARGRAAARSLRGLASTDRPQVGHFTDSDVVLDFLARERASAAGRARHVVPGPLPAHQGPADGPRPAADRAARGRRRPGCASCTRRTATDYARLLRAPRRRRTARRCAAPTRPSCSCPGVGMFSFGANKQTARVAGEFYVNAINVMRGAEAVSTYAPIPEVGEVPDRVLGARGGQAGRGCPAPKPLADAGRVRDRRRVRASARPSPIASRPRAPAWSSPTSTAPAPRPSPTSSAARTSRSPSTVDVTDEAQVVDGVPRRRARLRRRRPRRQQRRPVDLEAAARDDARATGTCSTTSWPAARSWSRARRRGS